LELAGESGTNFSGVLCGRATWKDGMPVYAKQGLQALEDWLSDQGVKNIQNVNNKVSAAKPWYSYYDVMPTAASD
jgi:tagatose 1,6-diphosphate aldolase